MAAIKSLAQIIQRCTIVNAAMSATAAILAANELIADTQVINDVFRTADVGGFLESVTIIDADAQGAALGLVFLSADVSLGSENNTPTISDANAVNIQGMLNIATTDYVNLTQNRVAMVGNLHRLLMPIPGTRNLAMAIVNGAGTPTFAGGLITVRLGLMLD